MVIKVMHQFISEIFIQEKNIQYIVADIFHSDQYTNKNLGFAFKFFFLDPHLGFLYFLFLLVVLG